MTTLFLCGDVMTGRGIDQILAHPSQPRLQEPSVQDARDYVALAEEAHGPISRPVSPKYIWGEALPELERRAPDARIINLETSVTTSDEFWPGKAVHYRMHPENVVCLTALRPDLCVLANNHVLDCGYGGLDETIRVLTAAGLRVAGAGVSIDRVREPGIVELDDGRRILVCAVGSETSGIPPSWAAATESAGVDLLPDLSDTTANDILNRVRARKRRGDVAIVSVHWGSNWGYEVPPSQVRFAHRLLDGNVDLIHGHSSHHPRPIEVYKGKLVLYGCGDFIDDYEGITGYEQFRDELVLMYFPTVDVDTGRLVQLRMTPLQIRRMRLARPSSGDREWLRKRLGEVSESFGCDVKLGNDGTLILEQLAPSRARRGGGGTIWLADGLHRPLHGGGGCMPAIAHESVAVPIEAGQQINGDLGIPERASGLVVFAHGSGSSRFSSRNRAVADTLQQRGLGTLLLDLLTEEEERVDLQTTEYRFDIDRLATRVVAATDWVRNRDDLLWLPVGYFGASTGAAAALMAAAERRETVRAVVSRGGRPDLAGAALPRVKAATLLIVGGRDEPVIELNEEAKAHMRDAHVELTIVPGASHLFEEPGALEQVAELAGDWFVRYLPPER